MILDDTRGGKLREKTQLPRRGAEDGEQRRANGLGDMHETGIVGDQQLAAFDYGCRSQE